MKQLERRVTSLENQVSDETIIFRIVYDGDPEPDGYEVTTSEGSGSPRIIVHHPRWRTADGGWTDRPPQREDSEDDQNRHEPATVVQ